MNVFIIIPVLNEEDALPLVLKSIPEQYRNKIIVVDNGSADASAEKASEHGAMLAFEPRRGYGHACLAGMSILPEDCDTVVFLDGDYSDYPEEIVYLLEPIAKNSADLVVGSRMSGKRRKGALPLHSILGNRLASLLARLMYGTQITDIGPFRAIRRSVLEDLEMQQKTFGWTVEMIAKAANNGCRIVEVPVSYRRRVGKSKITGTLKGSVLAAYYIIFTLFKCSFAKSQS